jgi:hypothetical protein
MHLYNSEVYDAYLQVFPEALRQAFDGPDYAPLGF